MELSKAIKLIRTASGMKQKDAARKLGITANYLSLVESGKREPSIAFMKRLAHALNVPVGIFFLWEQGKHANPQNNINQVRDLLARLEAMYVSSQRPKRRQRVA